MRSKGNVKNSIARQFYKRFCQKSTVVKFEMGDGVKQRKNRWIMHGRPIWQGLTALSTITATPNSSEPWHEDMQARLVVSRSFS